MLHHSLLDQMKQLNCHRVLATALNTIELRSMYNLLSHYDYKVFQFQLKSKIELNILKREKKKIKTITKPY